MAFEVLRRIRRPRPMAVARRSISRPAGRKRRVCSKRLRSSDERPSASSASNEPAPQRVSSAPAHDSIVLFLKAKPEAEATSGALANVVRPFKPADVVKTVWGRSTTSMANSPANGTTPSPTCRIEVRRPPIRASRRKVSCSASRCSFNMRETSHATARRTVLWMR